MIPKEIKDIQSYLDSIPYGKVTLEITRVGSKTVEIDTGGTQTLRINTNQEAKDRINYLLDNLTDTGYSGVLDVQFIYNNGTLKLMGVKDKKITKY